MTNFCTSFMFLLAIIVIIGGVEWVSMKGLKSLIFQTDVGLVGTFLAESTQKLCTVYRCLYCICISTTFRTEVNCASKKWWKWVGGNDVLLTLALCHTKCYPCSMYLIRWCFVCVHFFWHLSRKMKAWYNKKNILLACI